MSKKIDAKIVAFIIISLITSVIWFEICGGNSIKSDGLYYYEYFRRIFLQRHIQNTGMIKYPVGTALFELPFLLLAYLSSKLLGINTEGGYNTFFQHAVLFAALFWVFVAFIFIYTYLIKKYSKRSSILVCFSLFFGTMLPVYVTEMASYAHAYGFFSCTLFWFYISWYENEEVTFRLWKGGKQYSLSDNSCNFILGGLLGLCALIRNTNIIIWVTYIFYGVHSFHDLYVRIKTKIVPQKIIMQIFGFVSVYCIQVVLWRIMCGRWVIYSYSGESFTNWLSPHFEKVLFSDAKGLFIFCPILIIAIISMVVFKNNNEYEIAQWFIFLVVTYIISSWWCWWLGGAYSERLYCDILCIFTIPLVRYFDNMEQLYIQTKRKPKKNRIIYYIYCFMPCVFILVNLFLIYGTSKHLVSNNFATWYELNKLFFGWLHI